MQEERVVKERQALLAHWDNSLDATGRLPDAVASRVYVQSYKDNIQTVYPFIPPRALDALARDDPDQNPCHRSGVGTALALLVMALGQACHGRDLANNVQGMDYFVPASRLLGELIGLSQIEVVWVYLLTGLYYDQLGWVVQGAEYIALAGRALAKTLRSCISDLLSGGGGQAASRSEEHNTILFSFWTNFLQQVYVQPSGLAQYRGAMPRPDVNTALRSGIDEQTLQAFTTQIFFLNHRHEISDTLRLLKPSPLPPTNQVDILFDTLLALQKNETVFHGDDARAAHLRAYSWDVCVATLWPSLRAALCRAAGTGEGGRDNECDDRLIRQAYGCIDALVKHAQALLSLAGCAGINRFGTLRSLWRNLVLLSVVLDDRTLGPQVHPPTLKHLFEAAIALYEQAMPRPAGALGVDVKVLRQIGASHVESYPTPTKLSSGDEPTSAYFKKAFKTPPIFERPSPASPSSAAAMNEGARTLSEEWMNITRFEWIYIDPNECIVEWKDLEGSLRLEM
ncbi:hypothetical protein SPI_01589 [Niveomyces insectorum RCEF 264]|uniref:Uncharacterized protein n=1 Tax=Niveomyces insectorum RCEF 264 TaxID=1081102 RepID=A0A167Z2U9_9HYPO|nr:hypothetical protein SPI_01589 [Niveomyces insectorum RCEF 264]